MCTQPIPEDPLEDDWRSSELSISYDVTADHFQNAWESSFPSLFEFRIIMILFVIMGVITSINPSKFYYAFPLVLLIKFVHYLMKEIHIEILFEIRLR